MIRLLLFFSPSRSPRLARPRTPAGRPEGPFLAERSPGNLGQVVLVAEGRRAASHSICRPTTCRIPASRRAGLQPPAGGEGCLVANITLPEEGKFVHRPADPRDRRRLQTVVISAEDPFQAGRCLFLQSRQQDRAGLRRAPRSSCSSRRKARPLRPPGAKPESYYDVGIGSRGSRG